MAGSGPAMHRAVAERAQRRCEYCHCPEAFVGSSFCLEHIVPKAAGGPAGLENLAFACPGCNAFKGDKTAALDPVTREAARLFHPRRDRWKTHFRWSADALDLLSLTPVGRVTVATLRMNRPGLRNLRRALKAIGVHPQE